MSSQEDGGPVDGGAEPTESGVGWSRAGQEEAERTHLAPVQRESRCATSHDRGVVAGRIWAKDNAADVWDTTAVSWDSLATLKARFRDSDDIEDSPAFWDGFVTGVRSFFTNPGLDDFDLEGFVSGVSSFIANLDIDDFDFDLG